MPAFNAEFPQPARKPGSAFVPCRDLAALDDVLCEVHECAVRRDNCFPSTGWPCLHRFSIISPCIV